LVDIKDTALKSKKKGVNAKPRNNTSPAFSNAPQIVADNELASFLSMLDDVVFRFKEMSYQRPVSSNTIIVKRACHTAT